MAIIAGGIDTLVYCIIVLLASRRHTASFFGNYGTKISIIFGILLIFLSLSLFVSLLIAMSSYSMLSGTSMDSYDDLVRSATRLHYRYDTLFGFEPSQANGMCEDPWQVLIHNYL